MNLIIETDLGHDPDDFFAICYLTHAGAKIRAISVVPGDLDQVAMAKFLVDKLQLEDCVVTTSAIEKRDKYSSGSIHYDILDAYSVSREANPDGYGPALLAKQWVKYPDSKVFVIGPCTNIGRICEHPGTHLNGIGLGSALMQGGFLGYPLYAPQVRLPQFEGKTWVPTFNLNGDRKGAEHFMKAPFQERRFVGKNVCHTLIYDKEQFDSLVRPGYPDAAWTLFHQGMEFYLNRHDGKKWHDPTAAVLLMHPEIGTWVRGRVKKMEGGWGTELDDTGDYILADIDRDKLWEYTRNLS